MNIRYAILILLMSGCTHSDVAFATYKPSTVEVMGRADGILRLQGNCIYLQTKGDRYFVLWPEGTVFIKGSPSRIIDSRGVAGEAGSKVVLRGGETGRDAFTDNPKVSALMRRCGGPFFITYGIEEK